MFLSVTEVQILVTRWQHVSTHLEVLGVCVTLGSLEMDLHAQVIYITCSKPPSHHHFLCVNIKGCEFVLQ